MPHVQRGDWCKGLISWQVSGRESDLDQDELGPKVSCEGVEGLAVKAALLEASGFVLLPGSEAVLRQSQHCRRPGTGMLFPASEGSLLEALS